MAHTITRATVHTMTRVMARVQQKVSTPGQPIATKGMQYSATIDNGLLSGFIHHPSAFPLSCKRLWLGKENKHSSENEKSIGLCFRSENYLKPGIRVKISIPLRGEIQVFSGKVVLLRNMGDHFEIGIWLTSEDVHRVRVVEQICHIETYLRTKRHHNGPFVNDERVAEEWINKYAAIFPSAR